MSAWKAFETQCAKLIGGVRFWANSGESVDFEGPHAFGQAKLRRALSLNAITKLAESLAKDARARSKLPLVCVKVRRGSGSVSAPLVVMTFDVFDQWFSMRTPPLDKPRAPVAGCAETHHEQQGEAGDHDHSSEGGPTVTRRVHDAPERISVSPRTVRRDQDATAGAAPAAE